MIDVSHDDCSFWPRSELEANTVLYPMHRHRVPTITLALTHSLSVRGPLIRPCIIHLCHCLTYPPSVSWYYLSYLHTYLILTFRHLQAKRILFSSCWPQSSFFLSFLFFPCISCLLSSCATKRDRSSRDQTRKWITWSSLIYCSFYNYLELLFSSASGKTSRDLSGKKKQSHDGLKITP